MSDCGGLAEILEGLLKGAAIGVLLGLVLVVLICLPWERWRR